jgi:hypothetical protein
MNCRFEVPIIATVLLAACGSDTPTGVSGIPSRTLTALRGQLVDIRLQTIGPGEYDSLPTISSPAVRFRGASEVTPAVPAGATQLFHFLAIAPGRAIITFRHNVQPTPVIDTVDVQ